MDEERLRKLIREEVRRLLEVESSWDNKLTSNDYQVTSDQRATHKNYLDMWVPFKKKFDRILNYGKRSGIFNQEEYDKILEVKQLMDQAAVPISLLKTKEQSSGFSIDDLRNRD